MSEEIVPYGNLPRREKDKLKRIEPTTTKEKVEIFKHYSPAPNHIIVGIPTNERVTKTGILLNEEEYEESMAKKSNYGFPVVAIGDGVNDLLPNLKVGDCVILGAAPITRLVETVDHSVYPEQKDLTKFYHANVYRRESIVIVTDVKEKLGVDPMEIIS